MATGMNRYDALEELNAAVDFCQDCDEGHGCSLHEPQWQAPHIKVSAEIKRILKAKAAHDRLKGSVNFIETRAPDYYDYPPSQRQRKKLRLHRDTYAELLEKQALGEI